MKYRNLKKIMVITLIIMSAITFYACRKNLRGGATENVSQLNEAKSYMTTLVKSENSLLALPYSELKKSANLRRFARIGKLNDAAKWSDSRSYYRNGIAFSIVPVNNDVHYLHNPSIESVRYLLFSKRDGDLMEMNIIEMYSDGTLGTDLTFLLQTTVENMFFTENRSIEHLSASVIFYDRFYNRKASYSIENGNWKKANIIVENTIKKPILSTSKIQLNSKSSGNIGDQAKGILSTVSPMSGCGSCNTYYTVGIWYDMTTGDVVSMEILGSWEDCSSDVITPPGSSPGQTGGGSDPNSGLEKKLTNNLTNPCMSSVLSTDSSRISSFIGSALNNENISLVSG